MSKKIRFYYALNNVSDRSFIMAIERDLTCKDVLQKISEKQKLDYISIFYEGSEINTDDEIIDYWETDPDYIFYVSTVSEPPTREFMDNINMKRTTSKSAKLKAPEISDHDKDKSTSDAKPAKTESKADKSASKATLPKMTPGVVVGKPILTHKASDSPSSKAVKLVAPIDGPKVLQTPTDTQDKASLYAPQGQQHDIHKSYVGPENISTRTVPYVRPPDKKDKYYFYFTGSTKDHLLNGIEVELDTAMNPTQCRNKLQEVLQDNDVNIKNKQLIIYLPGGIPFIGGTLGDIFLKEDFKARKVIYGVLTRRIPDKILNLSCVEMCNVSDEDHQLLISPICKSTKRGLSDMACLMGYLNHDGIKGDILLKTCAAVIHFPPLVTCMNRIIERNQVVGRDVVTVCSTFYTYLRAQLPTTCVDEKVFEYLLRMCNLISHISDIPEKLPIMTLEVKPEIEDTKFLADLKLGPFVYFWRADIGEDFNFVDLDLQGVEAIEHSYNVYASFTPIAPLSMRAATGCSIVRGKDYEYLYLMQSPSKDSTSQNKVDIIDPTTGMTESKDIEIFAQEQGNTKADDAANLIDPDRVKQIIMVNFDESKSMIGDLEGYVINPKSDKDHRVTIAIQYLTAFANRTYGYRIPCIQGLVSFNNKITVRCPLSPLVPDFEDKGLKKIEPYSVTKLWDSLACSCQEIIKFRKDSRNVEKYKNAVSRILVISDGEDVNSKAKVEDVVKELIKNKIIVDSVIISKEDEGCKMLCAVCHATGGLAFKPDNVNQGLSLFEQSAFLNYEERKTTNNPLIPNDRKTIPARLEIEHITAEFMEKVSKIAQFDDVHILNKELLNAAARTRLATPRHVCAKNRDTQIQYPRQRRILRELHAAAVVNDINHKDYDPDMKIFTFQANLDRWRVYLKGPENTPYANKWWYLYVTFPELYPVQAPVFRFVSVPYHLNVSSEGRICLNVIEKGYISSKTVVDIIQEIKELFLLPSISTPVQIETYDLFMNDKNKYEELAKESANKYGMDDYKDFIGDSSVIDEVPKDFKITFTDKDIPPYMRSQISGKPISPEKRVMASSGVYYDRDELRQLVASNKNPVCVITGKILTEKPTDHIFDPDYEGTPDDRPI